MIASKPAALAMVLAASGLFACATSSKGGAASAEASDFTLPTSEGGTMSLSEHLGKKVIVLNFWATWCVPCTMELPHLEKLYQEKKGDGLLVLGIAMDGPETVASVGPFAKRQGLSFPVLLDEETRAVALYNPRRAAPYTVFVDRSGKVASAREGYTLGDEKAIEQTVSELLAQGASTVAAPAVSPDGSPR